MENPDEDYFKSINKLIYKFIYFRIKLFGLKGNTLVCHVKEGGLGITDVDSKIKALKPHGSLDYKKQNNVLRVP